MTRVWRWTPLYGALPLLLALVALGCATDNGATDDDIDPADDIPGDLGGLGPGGLNRGEVPVSVKYKRTAEGNWVEGNKSFEDEEYLAAQRYFQYIKVKFPYSRFAALSEVRIGDCLFERDRYLEAIDVYQSFVRTHPTHKQVPYAMFRVGVAYYEQIPGNYFLLPPSHEKDQAAVKDAEQRLSEYVRRFPKDEHAAEAKTKLDEVRRRLMAHERYVADFYRNLDRYRAYAGRLEVIRRDFAEVGLTDDLLLEIAEAWAKAGEVDKAKSAAEQLAKDFPASELNDDAQEAVAEAEARAKKNADAEAQRAEAVEAAKAERAAQEAKRAAETAEDSEPAGDGASGDEGSSEDDLKSGDDDPSRP